jgi:hypothetical protein
VPDGQTGRKLLIPIAFIELGLKAIDLLMPQFADFPEKLTDVVSQQVEPVASLSSVR